MIVGDLNEDVGEYVQHDGEYITALMPEGASAPAVRSLTVTSDPRRAGRGQEGPVFYSPWLSSTDAGSYFHGGRWERLDQALVLPGTNQAVSASLSVVNHPELLTADGRPARYDSRTGYGYSDHLPVLVTLRLEPVR